MKKFAIIVAAGAGKRFSKDLPKQFELLGGKPMLMHSITAFNDAAPDIHILVVIAKRFISYWKECCHNHNFNIRHEITEGGPERYHSVKNGLSLINGEGLIAIHDGARPLIKPGHIKNIFALAERYGAVAPVIEISDSMRQVDGALHKPVDRKKYRLVQTPQVFKTALLQNAYRQQYDSCFTDDATVVEAAGEKVVLMEGDPENIKVTQPADLVFAESLLAIRKSTE